jgi:hypothetical protein
MEQLRSLQVENQKLSVGNSNLEIMLRNMVS